MCHACLVLQFLNCRQLWQSLIFLPRDAQVQLQAQQAAYRQQQEKQHLAEKAAQHEAAGADRDDGAEDAAGAGAFEPATAAVQSHPSSEVKAHAQAAEDSAADEPQLVRLTDMPGWPVSPNVTSIGATCGYRTQAGVNTLWLYMLRH